jgi:hypothetical protein
MSRLVKLYPREWRMRYGYELEEAAAASPGWRTQIDLVRGAIDAWTRSPGGNQMTDRLTKVAAALMVMPLFFLVMNLVNEMTGSERILLQPFFTSRIGEIAVVFSPFVALALVTLPSLRIAVDHQQGQALSISLRLGRFQLLILALAALTAVAFLGYAFLENFAPRIA